jgi:hypothetical protein
LWFEGSGGFKLAIGGKQQQGSWSEVEEPKVPLRVREKASQELAGGGDARRGWMLLTARWFGFHGGRTGVYVDVLLLARGSVVEMCLAGSEGVVV